MMTSTRPALIPSLLLLAGNAACGAGDPAESASASETSTSVTSATTPTSSGTPTTGSMSASETTPTEGSGTATGGTTGTPDPSTGTTAGNSDPTSPLLDVGANTTGDTDGGEVVTCDDAADKPSNLGCEFWAVDMDQQDGFNDPASAPWGVAISPAGFGQTEVTIEINLAPPGQPLDLMVVKQLSIGQDEVVPVELPTRADQRANRQLLPYQSGDCTALCPGHLPLGQPR